MTCSDDGLRLHKPTDGQMRGACEGRRGQVMTGRCCAADAASTSGSDGTKYFPTLTKVNALFDHCADGLVGLFKTKPAAAAAASGVGASNPKATSSLRPAASAAATSRQPKAAFSLRSASVPGPELRSPAKSPLQSPFQAAPAAELPGSSGLDAQRSAASDNAAADAPARLSPAESRASPESPSDNAAEGSVEGGRTLSEMESGHRSSDVPCSTSEASATDAAGEDDAGTAASSGQTAAEDLTSAADMSSAPGKAGGDPMPPHQADSSHPLIYAGFW